MGVSGLDKDILGQYCDMQEEIKDLRHRIDETKRELDRVQQEGYIVADSVKGTRKDGIFGNITIKGFPYPEYDKLKDMYEQRVDKLKGMERRLFAVIHGVEDYIESIEDSKTRRIFWYRYIDGSSWGQVAKKMGKGYSADACRKMQERYFEKN